MITLPSALLKLQQGNDLRSIKPYVLLYRNQWNGQTHTFELENTPLDITEFIIKPNTLSMTLDVNEVAQYNANNMTLTLVDYQNRFVEGTPNSFFSAGYQLYGSHMVLYYGIDSVNRTALFTGVIKDLPTYKPETYQVDIKLVSPLELMSEMEAKEFSNKVIGETLIFDHTDSEGNPVYRTAFGGVGSVKAVYADGQKLFETTDYNLENINLFGIHALITITGTEYHASTLTADYYHWKTGLTIDQIVTGLVEQAGYTSNRRDVRRVVWNTAIRNNINHVAAVMSLGFYANDSLGYDFNWFNTRDNVWQNTIATNESRLARKHILPENFETEFTIKLNFNNGSWGGTHAFYQIGTAYTGSILNEGIRGYLYKRTTGVYHIGFDIVTNGNTSNDIWSEEVGSTTTYVVTQRIKIRKLGTQWYLFVNGTQVATFTKDIQANYDLLFSSNKMTWSNLDQIWRMLDANANPVGPDLYVPCILTTVLDKGSSTSATWGAVSSLIEGESASATVTAYFSSDSIHFDSGTAFDLGAIMGKSERYLKYVLQVSSPQATAFTIESNQVYFLDTSLALQYVDLSDKTVLEALQDFALISGYEFGVDRNGIFFFRPRIQSSVPIYTLDHTELIQVASIKKNLTDFFTKLTLSFATHPLEFYADTGERPTPIDRYGVINKEIEKPEIINYDNPELANAIGPQLLTIYADLRNRLQVTAKLNLALELGDIVNLKRSYIRTVDKTASDSYKYAQQQTFFRACKIVGINYNLSKQQISYTLQDISNKNNMPTPTFNEFAYEFPIELGAKL